MGVLDAWQTGIPRSLARGFCRIWPASPSDCATGLAPHWWFRRLLSKVPNLIRRCHCFMSRGSRFAVCGNLDDLAPTGRTGRTEQCSSSATSGQA